MRREVQGFLAAVVASLAWFCGAEETVRITVFELKDGTKIRALRYSVLEADGVTEYTITPVQGKKIKVKGDQVADRTESTLEVSKLPDSAKTEADRKSVV
jgi:hypothetical protein